MCCRRKQPPEGSQQDSATDRKRQEDGGGTSREGQHNLAGGVTEQGTQQSSKKETNDGMETGVEKQPTDRTMTNGTSSRKVSPQKSKELLKPLKLSKEFLKDDCPQKAIEQARTGTAAVDDAEFGWTDGSAGGLTLFTKSADSKEPFGKSSEMMAQRQEKEEALARRRVEISMTQSTGPADMRTRVEETA